jgi:hypothetical protein
LEEALVDDSGRIVRIGSQLDEELKVQLVTFLRDNTDIFAWSHEDMPGVDSSIMVHKLNMDLDYQPVKQQRIAFPREIRQLRRKLRNYFRPGSFKSCTIWTNWPTSWW